MQTLRVKISFEIHDMKKKKKSSRTTLSDFPACGVFLAKQLLLYCREHTYYQKTLFTD